MMRTGRWAVLAVLTLGVWGCRQTEAEEATTLQMVAAELGDLRITAEATGQIEPIRKVEVKSKASGEVLRLHVDVGDAVAPGALLAEVDPRDVKNRHDQAVADHEVAQARADIAAAQLGRSEELHASGVITDQEVESARLENSNAQANLIKARTNTDLAELQLEDVTIRAPMAGTILQKSVEEGQVIQSASQNVSGGTTLYMMANLEQMQVRTLVDETDMGEIRSGMPTTVRVEAFPDRAFEGVVQKIEPQAVVQQNVTMFPVIVTLDNRAGLLKPGMNAEVEILIDQAQGILLIPNGAVVLPTDVEPAAAALGLDPETLDLAQFRAGRGGGGGGGRGPQGGGAARGAAAQDEENEPAAGGDAPAGDRPAAEEPAAGARAPGGAGLQELRAMAERGDISQDSLRSALQSLRAPGQAAGGAGGGRGQFLARVAGGGAPGAFPGAPARQTRRAVVFVVDSAGVPAPRMIEIGLSDWDRTQVVSGLEEGDQLAVVGVAQLQEQQRNQQGFRGGMMPFGGGMRVR
jgi:HlyD family secretion protein